MVLLSVPQSGFSPIKNFKISYSNDYMYKKTKNLQMYYSNKRR